MVKVKFLVDFRGKLTKEQFYTAGTVAEFDVAIAQQLFDGGRAEPADVDAETKPKRKKGGN